MMYEPQHLDLWTTPKDWFGKPWPDHYVFLGQHRDSDSLSRSNFICGLEAIGGESETVTVVRESHWVVGWIEWIAIHKSDDNALRVADEIESALSDYPVVDESHWDEMEWNEAQKYWASMTIQERIDVIKWSGSDASIFAARRDWTPDDSGGEVYQWLRD